MPEQVTVRCRCGATVVYNNPNVGCTNIGHFERTTGWFTAMDRMTQASLWICPGCTFEMRRHARAILEILGTGDVSVTQLLPFKERDMTYLFVYGIFKQRGAGSYMLMGECEFLDTATAPGFVLLDHNGPAAMVPGNYCFRDTDRVAKGEVITVPDEQRKKVLHQLDRVEANGQSYIRVKIEAILDGSRRRVEAYAYLWMEYYAENKILKDGTWDNCFTGKGSGI